MDEPDEPDAPWLAELKAKDEALQSLRVQIRQQAETIDDLRASGARRTALSESLSKQIDRLSDRCDELSQLEQQQRQETETQRRLLAELRQRYESALREANSSRQSAKKAQLVAAELQVKLSEALPDEALQARILELESRLVSSVPEGAGGLDTLREQLGQMERRMQVAQTVGLLNPATASVEAEDHELQLELERALEQQSTLQERLRSALLCGAGTVAVDDPQGVDENSSLVTQLRQQLEHEKKERSAAEALVAALKQTDDERIDRMRESTENASKLALEAEVARDAAIRELAAMQRGQMERDRGQTAEQRRNRRELMQVTQQLEQAKSELAAAQSDLNSRVGEDSIHPSATGTDTNRPLAALLQPDDGAGPELLHKVSRRDVRQLRLERDRALRRNRQLEEEHEVAKAQLAATTTEAIEREQQRTAELETQLEDLVEQLTDAEQRATSGVSDREHEAQLVAENLGSEVTRLKNELTRARERAKKSDARLAESEQKTREGMERMRERYEDEIGALEAQLAGTSTQSGDCELGSWKQRADKAEETASKLQEEVAALRTENTKLTGLVRDGTGAAEDTEQQSEIVSADPRSSEPSSGESRSETISERREETSLSVQKELEEIAADLMRQVESLLDENHKLRAKIQHKRARAKEKKRRAQGSQNRGNSNDDHGYTGSSWTIPIGGLGQSTPQRELPMAEAMGRPGATPAAQPQSHRDALVGTEVLTPQRMQNLLYGSNDPGASPKTRAIAREAVKTRRHAPAVMFDVSENAGTSADRATGESGVSNGNVGDINAATLQPRPLPFAGIAGLTAEQASALAEARSAVLAPSPLSKSNSNVDTVRDVDNEPTTRERRRLEILKLAQAIRGDAGTGGLSNPNSGVR